MNILHASTDPTLLARLKEMLGSSARADIAVGYFFMSGFEQVALGSLRALRGNDGGDRSFAAIANQRHPPPGRLGSCWHSMEGIH